MGSNRKSKHRKHAGAKAAQVADSASTARSSSETIRPCRRQKASEGEASNTTTQHAPTPSSEPNTNTTDQGAKPGKPVSDIEAASEDMESLDRQTTKSTNEGSVSAPGLEQSGDADAPDISLISPSGTTRSDDTAAVKDASAVPHLFSVEDQPDNLVETGDEKQASEPEPSAVIPSQPDEAEDKSAGDLSDAGSQTPLGETQSETGAATDDGSQSNNDDIDMEMILHMEQGRKESRTNDSDSEDRSMAGGNSEVDAAEGEQDHTEENEGQGDPGTEQSQLPHIQEPPDPERSEAQELQVEREEASQDPMRPDPETSQPAFATTGGKPQGLRGRRPSATHLTIAVDSQASPVTVIEARPRAVRDLVHQKGQFLEEDSRASRAIASVANYIDGVGGRPSQEDMEALEEFKTYVAERAKALQEILDGEEPMDALQRFDQRWQQRSLDEAWGDRQDVRLAAVRAAMYLGQDDGNMQGELAIMYFEHKVAELREKLGDDFDDPVALQTMDILRAGRG